MHVCICMLLFLFCFVAFPCLRDFLCVCGSVFVRVVWVFSGCGSEVSGWFNVCMHVHIRVHVYIQIRIHVRVHVHVHVHVRVHLLLVSLMSGELFCLFCDLLRDKYILKKETRNMYVCMYVSMVM